MRAKVSIIPTMTGSRIEVDGRDISTAVRGATVWLRAGEPPEVDLELAVVDITSLGADQVELSIPTDVHEALVALGWTPPPEET